MTLSEFIAEIQTDLSSFADDINKVSVKTDVINCLRKFGNNISQVNERVLTVKNSTTKLPDEFKSLKLAIKLNAEGYYINGDRSKGVEEYIFKQYIEDGAYFDEINQEYVITDNPKIVTEKIIIDNSAINCYYTPQWLSLVKGINKDNLAVDCLNIHPSIRNTYPNEISISNNYINTNFTKGQIYIQYNSLPTEDGEISIPEMTTGDLLEYIKLYVKVKIAEDLMVNNKNAQGLGQMYQLWIQQLPMLKRAAMTESRFFGLPKSWTKNFKAKNREQISFFNLPGLPNV